MLLPLIDILFNHGSHEFNICTGESDQGRHFRLTYTCWTSSYSDPLKAYNLGCLRTTLRQLRHREHALACSHAVQSCKARTYSNILHKPAICSAELAAHLEATQVQQVLIPMLRNARIHLDGLMRQGNNPRVVVEAVQLHAFLLLLNAHDLHPGCLVPRHAELDNLAEVVAGGL